MQHIAVLLYFFYARRPVSGGS